MPSRPKELADIVSESDFQKSQRYNLDKSRFGFIENLWKQLEVLLQFHYNVIPWLWDFTGRLLYQYAGYGPDHEVKIQDILLGRREAEEESDRLRNPSCSYAFILS